MTINITNFEALPGGGWDRVVQFTIGHALGLSDTEIDDELYQLMEWISNTFSHGFVLLEIGSRILCGGNVDNLINWRENISKEFPRHKEKFFGMDKFELRGYDNDLALFLLKYKEK